MVGLTVTVQNASRLLAARVPDSSWRFVLICFNLLLGGWMMIAFWESSWDGQPEFKKEHGYALVLAACMGVVIWQTKPPLMFGLLGILSALFFLSAGRIWGRIYYVATVGWFLSGVTVMGFAAWPTQDQESLFLCLGGVATSLQAAWELFTSARSLSQSRHP